MSYVYIITNKINSKKYIGSSRKHKIDENYYGSGKAIKNALKKHGKENFIREILWEGEGDARSMEIYFLEKVNAANNPLYYNMTNDARGNNLHKKETKQTVSEKLTGRKFSQETCSKISKNKTGIRFSEGYKTRKDKGNPRPTTKGRISPNEGKGRKVDLFSCTGEYIKTYLNYNHLAKDLNINPETVRCHLIGKAKSICKKQYVVKYSI